MVCYFTIYIYIYIYTISLIAMSYFNIQHKLIISSWMLSYTVTPIFGAEHYFNMKYKLNIACYQYFISLIYWVEHYFTMNLLIKISMLIISSMDQVDLNKEVKLEFMVWFGLFGFYGISTIIGYSMPNPLYTYILSIYDLVWLDFKYPVWGQKQLFATGQGI